MVVIQAKSHGSCVEAYSPFRDGLPVKIDPELLPFGATVRSLREKLDLSQEELADRAGLHRNYIGGIERGERNVGIKAVYRLARGLNVSPSELFAEDEPDA